MEISPELATAIIACLGAVAAWLKAHSDVGQINNERAETKILRDKDSQEMHDAILKLQFQAGLLKDENSALKTRIDDCNKQITTLTTQLAEVLVRLDNIIETLKELKEVRDA